MQSIHFTDGVTKLAWDPKRSCMFAGLKSGLVLLYLVTFSEVNTDSNHARLVRGEMITG